MTNSKNKKEDYVFILNNKLADIEYARSKDKFSKKGCSDINQNLGMMVALQFSLLCAAHLIPRD